VSVLSCCQHPQHRVTLVPMDRAGHTKELVLQCKRTQQHILTHCSMKQPGFSEAQNQPAGTTQTLSSSMSTPTRSKSRCSSHVLQQLCYPGQRQECLRQAALRDLHFCHAQWQTGHPTAYLAQAERKSGVQDTCLVFDNYIQHAASRHHHKVKRFQPAWSAVIVLDSTALSLTRPAG
jgi:hypothetical protein